MSKPEWEDAPEWANWLAMDESGIWCWFISEPRQGCMCWMPCNLHLVNPDGDTYDVVDGEFESAALWSETLESRP